MPLANCLVWAATALVLLLATFRFLGAHKD
jgi:hypothetical protein